MEYAAISQKQLIALIIQRYVFRVAAHFSSWSRYLGFTVNVLLVIFHSYVFSLCLPSHQDEIIAGWTRPVLDVVCQTLLPQMHMELAKPDGQNTAAGHGSYMNQIKEVFGEQVS